MLRQPIVAPQLARSESAVSNASASLLNLVTGTRDCLILAWEQWHREDALVIVLLQLVTGFIVAFGLLMVLARLLSAWGGVGSAELALLSVPAALLGVWTSRRVRSRFRSA